MMRICATCKEEFSPDAMELVDCPECWRKATTQSMMGLKDYMLMHSLAYGTKRFNMGCDFIPKPEV